MVCFVKSIWYGLGNQVNLLHVENLSSTEVALGATAKAHPYILKLLTPPGCTYK